MLAFIAPRTAALLAVPEPARTGAALQEIYQQPDDETLLRVVTGGAELRSTG